MDSQENSYPEIRVLTTPKWATPVALFVAMIMIAFSIFTTSTSWAFGALFGFGSAEAQDGPSYNKPSKFGVNSAQWVNGLGPDVVRNSAALSGPGGTIVGMIQGTDRGWVDATKSFIDSAKQYCLTPILRLDAGPSAAEWGTFFSQIGGNDGKLVISIGNEVNFKFEFSEGFPNSGSYYAKYLADTADAIRPGVGPDAKIIGSPLNTSAPCPGNDAYVCWTDFIAQMGNTANWKGKIDGHASNPYPVAGLSSTLYKDELGAFGYSLPVYIIETGPHEDVPVQGTGMTAGQFMNDYWDIYCGDTGVAAVNFFNAAGNNPDPCWNSANGGGCSMNTIDGTGYGNFSFTKEDAAVVTDERVSTCSEWAHMEIRYTDFSSCTIVDRSEYEPMASAGGGASTGARCISDVLTPLIPKPQEYSGTGEIQLEDGIGGAYALMTVKDVSTTAFLQNLNIENNTDVGNMSTAAATDKTLAWDVNYNVIAGYPADGRYYHKATPRVESWMDEGCMNQNSHNQAAAALGIPKEYWPFQTNDNYGMDQCGWGTDFDSRTMYADHLFHQTISKRDYVYFPLGTALGTVSAEDPYNIYANWMQAPDFQDEEGSAFTGTFDDQSASLTYFPSFLESKWAKFWLGILGWLDDGVDSNPAFTSVPGGLTMGKAYTRAKASGEAGVEIGDFDYDGSCAALEELVEDYNNRILPWYQSAVNSNCGRTTPILLDCTDGTLPPSDPLCQPSDTSKCSGYKDAQSKAEEAVKTIGALASRCRGNGKTKMKIAGVQQNDLAELELYAPFVPIMAQYRVWDVINARGTVCDTPDNELYGAEVTVDVSWYDKYGTATGQSYDTCDHGGTGIGPQNLLQNGSFEAAWGGAPGGTADGAAAPGWTFIWKKNYSPGDPGDQSPSCAGTNGENLEYCKAPEFQPIYGVNDQRRVLDGRLASKWFTWQNKHDVIAYQVVDNVPPGYSLSGYFQGWRNTDEGDGEFRNSSGCVQSDIGWVGESEAEICLYYGNIHDLIGDKQEIPMQDYDDMMDTVRKDGSCKKINSAAFLNEWYSETVKSRGGTVTVILRSSAAYAANNTDDYWDNVCLIPSGSAITENVEIPEAPPRSGGGDECRFYNPPQQVCELQVGSEGESSLLFTEEMTFYMPGLGAMPYIAQRLETGSSKSPDDTSEAPMCMDRTDSEVNHPYNKVYSALDIYIIQNLPEKYAKSFANFIAPAEYSVEEIAYIRDGVKIETGGGSTTPKDPGEAAPEGYNRTPTDNEISIMKYCNKHGLGQDQCAYVLATANFESSVQPKEEYGCCDRDYDESRCKSDAQDPCGCTADFQQSYGTCDPITNKCYYGRGYVQLTWKGNYQRMGDHLGLSLLTHPELAMDPDAAAEIITFGMQAGSFTGAALKPSYSDSVEAYIDSRKIINGDTTHVCSRSDCNDYETVGEHVAGIAYSYRHGTVMEDYDTYTLN